MRIEINSPFIKKNDASDFANLPVIVKVTGTFNEAAVIRLQKDCDEAMLTGQKILPIFIDSYGGYVDSLVGMVDYLQTVRDSGVKIITITCGKAMSCGAMLFSLGDERWVGSRSRVMFHRISGGAHGNPDDIMADAKESERLEKLIFEEASLHIGQKKNWLFTQLKERNFVDWILTPKECKELGVATHIGIPKFKFTVTTDFSYE